MYSYEKSPTAIYEESFATVRAETDLSTFTQTLHAPVIRMIHACGMIDLSHDITATPDIVERVHTALGRNGSILCDCEMVKAGIITRYLQSDTKVLTTLNDTRVPDLARKLGTTRSAAAVELWPEHTDMCHAIVVIGNAPTALFHLMECVQQQKISPPAAILGFPVGFVGAAESKAALAESGLPYFTVHGRRGGSAIASACLNGITQILDKRK